MSRHLIIAFLVCVSAFSLARAADHLDAPSLTGKGTLDINDVYAFQSPVDPKNTVIAFTVNPFSGVESGTTFGTTDTEYQLLIDNTGDAIPDVTYSATFAANGASQDLKFSRDGVMIANGAVETDLPVAGGGLVRAGTFDDPFFFDLVGFRNGFNFTGTDTFAGANVSAIVMEVPSSESGSANIGVYARTLLAGAQIDRMGRPAINTALIPSGKKEAFNQGLPAADLANFGDDARASITALSDAANAAALTNILFPDLLTIDTTNSGGFLNGRRLADDVIDAELNLLSGGAVTGDGVNGNNVPFRSSFPYLAVQNVPEPSVAALILLFAFHVLGLKRHRRF